MIMKKLRDYITDSLINGQQKKEDLVKQISQERGISPQAVYKLIRSMKQDEMLVEQKKMLSLNKVWIQKNIDFWQQAHTSHTGLLQNHMGIQILEEGDRATYSFSNPDQLDQMWGHFFLLFGEKIHKDVPILIYNPHFWFALVRAKSEKVLFGWLAREGKKSYLVSGSDASLDIHALKHFFNKKHHSYSVNTSLGFPKNYFLNIFGEYLIEVWLDESVMQEMDKIFREHNVPDQKVTKQLQEIVTTKGRNKLVISRNSKKASRLRKKLAKDFFIQKESRQYI